MNNNRSSNKLTHKNTSKNLNTSATSSSNILSSLASTPYSVIDQNDEIWIEFLNSLNEQTPELKSIDQTDSPLCSTNLIDETQILDNDDQNDDDPDFTVCLENYDLDDPDYDMDEWFQIPKKEAVELVKDAIEICDGAPIVYDDQRHSKIKSAITIKKISSEIKTKTIVKSKPKKDEEPQKIDAIQIEFIPEFTEIQKRQLDEQLRNHVQLLTQTCLFTFCSKEFNYIFDETHSLLKVLKSLNEVDKENEPSLLSLQNFEIINLNESLEIISNIQKMSKQDLNLDVKQGIPAKFLEIIITSPVFYNTNLVPNLTKFKFQSHFKRSQFTDTEKILLIMGFNKFKHLPKSECCDCIKTHLLPNRSSDDIRKQLNYFSSSEHRQVQLKELLKKQKQLMTNLMHDFVFVKDVHYKSPFDQADIVQLPSQYTIVIERIKLAKVLKDTRKTLKELKDKATETPEKDPEAQTETEPQPLTPSTILSQQIQSVTISKERQHRSQKLIEKPRTTPVQKIRPQITKVANQNKRQRSASPPPTPPVVDLQPDISVIEPSSPQRSPSPIVISSGPSSPEEIRQKETQSNKNTEKNPEPSPAKPLNNIPVITTLPTQSPIVLQNANFIDLFSRPGQIINPTILRPMTQAVPLLNLGRNFMMPQQSPPVYLPANFNGTVLIQPTIHIHTNSKNLNLSKYCQIKPKQDGKDYSNQTNKKKKC